MSCIISEVDLRTAIAAGDDIELDGGARIEISSPIAIESPLRVRGGWLHSTEESIFEIHSGGVELDGVRLEGGGMDAGHDPAQKLVHALGTADNPLDNIRIRNCTFEQSRGDNIWLEWCTDSLIHDNVVRHYLYSGILVISGRGLSIENNIVRDALLTPAVSQVYGIALTDASNTEIARTRDCLVANNQVELIDWEGIETHGGQNLTIVGNRVLGCARGIALITGNQTRVLPPVDIVVSGNLIDGAGCRVSLREGVSLAGVSGAGASATITGNLIRNYERPFWTSYWDRDATYIGGNNVPHLDWRPVTMGPEFNANAVAPLEYMVDGKTVWLRGALVPNPGGLATNNDVGSLDNQAAWPQRLTFVCHIQGSAPAAGHGMLAVDQDGKLRMYYGTGTDRYNYYAHGSYRTV